ncbi:DUF3038 domain-containing protein [Pseudanabaena sp. FACHB-1277]|uniref:DUF3038 domain-containing protein n=1 Tax=Pseudanabaena cinerea FACHB-1277 TaxID=2949581 RepID=A0A926UW47_9CYAN|nr:DUF3038 domain-containing protein [Pseudanabaena cinerea]MBD2152144.1 DUF3038 domain-containing protein [Pseudanabaena cinerea FACHB-1277]
MQLNISAPVNPDLIVPKDFVRGCPRTVRMDIDHLLLAIEALDLEAVEVMLALIEQLGLEKTIPSRVAFWRLRNTNPLRRNYQRSSLDWDELKALVKIACAIAKQFDTGLRLLISTYQQVTEGKIEALGLQQNQFFLEGYIDRFRSLYIGRMRSPAPLNNEEIGELALQQLTRLLISSGTAGEYRLWNSLFDGAIA